MKVIVNSYDLAEAVNKVSKACATKDLKGQVLEGIKLSAYNDILTLTAFDGEMSIENEIKCETFIYGETVINGKLLVEYVNKLDGNEEVEIALQDNGQAKIRSGKLKFTISTLNAKEFPLIKLDKGENQFEIGVEDLKTLVNRVAFCAANDEARPILKGVLLETTSEKELVACALDGFRLAKATTNISNAKKENASCVVPARCLNELIKSIGKDTDKITLNIAKNMLSVMTDDTIFTTRLLVGDFVNYRALLSAPYNIAATVNREEFISSLNRMSILAKTANNLVRIDLNDDVISLSANTEIGEMHEEIEISPTNLVFTIYLNYKYLTDCLKSIDEEKVYLNFRDAQTPMFIRSAETIQNFWEYLVLPVRVSKTN